MTSQNQNQTSTIDYPPVPGPTPETSPALRALLESLQVQFGAALQGVILYGSCLRTGDLHEGLVDLYALVDSYRNAYRSPWLKLGNRLLPPNVYYLETATEDGPVRAKVAVLSLADFHRGTGRGWFESYLWGRFAQPVKLIYSATPQVEQQLYGDFLRAAETFLRRALPALPPGGRVTELWEGALALSYGTELRTERQDRAGELSRHGARFLEQVTQCLAPRLSDCLALQAPMGERAELHYRATVPSRARRRAPWLWGLRRTEGKLLSVLRLLKGLFTFEGGLDYIAWKLERHSGQKVEIPDKVRRHPLIHIWGLLWRLYRRGIFR